MSDMFVGSQAPLYQNVCITKRSKSGKILEQRFAKNRITRLMLFGIGRFLLGHFNDSTPDKIYEYIPRYLALGTNTPGTDADSTSVTRQSSVEDTRLLNEITVSSSTGTTEDVKRIWIAERNLCKLNTKFSDPFIKVSIKTYISSAVYNGMTIGEAGLFSKEKDNNCLARVCFNPIVKNEDEVLDIQWDITLLSYGETIYPDSLSIENGDRIAIPLKYTNRKFKEQKLGLTHNWSYDALGISKDDNFIEVFKYDSNGILSLANGLTINNIKEKTDWYSILQQNEVLESIPEDADELYIASLNDVNDAYFNLLVNTLIGSKLNDNEHPVRILKSDIPTPFYFGNLYDNSELEKIDSSELSMFMLFTEDQETISTETGYYLVSGNKSGEYVVTNDKGYQTEYRVVDNQFYKKHDSNSDYWDPLGYYLYNGTILDSNSEATPYTYNNSAIYSNELRVNETKVYQYVNFNANENTYKLYKIDNETGLILETNYKLDLNNDCEIYQLNSTGDYEDTYYHVSNDLYWVSVGESSDYVKLVPVILPKTVTDKSLSWMIRNNNIAKLNFDGVVLPWNVGETTAIVSTSNDLRASIIIDVVKETKFIDVDKITVDPKEVILYVDGDPNQYAIISATVEPMFATNATVQWNADSGISSCIRLINLGDNKVKIELNGSGNIGTGRVVAMSQSGQYDECLVNVIYKEDDSDCDCPDPSHDEQMA